MNENDEYESAKEQLPDLGEYINTPMGKGKVIGLNILEKIMQIELQGKERVVEYTLDEMMEEGTFTIQATD